MKVSSFLRRQPQDIGDSEGRSPVKLIAASPAGYRAGVAKTSLNDVFDDIARGLTELGFNVVRTPLPMAYDDDDSTNTRYWYFATGNNVLTQDNPRKVWIPSYGHGPWAKLAATDTLNQRIWELGGQGR